jgi:hypothetical protein
MKIINTIIVILTAVSFSLSSQGDIAVGDSVNLNLWAQVSGNNVGQVTGTFGTPNTQNSNTSGWNNKINPAGSGYLLSAAGEATSLTVSSVRPGGNSRDGSGATANNGQAYQGTAMRAWGAAGAKGLDVGREATLTISGLNADFADGYKILAYVGGANENGGAALALQKGSAADWAANYGADDLTADIAATTLNDSDTSTYFWKTRYTTTQYTSPVKITSTAYATTSAAVGDYAVWNDSFLKDSGGNYADEITVVVKSLYSNGTNPAAVGLGGIQIIAIPEPATAGLLGIFGAATILFRRRFKA